jgi:hypothetical protein
MLAYRDGGVLILDEMDRSVAKAIPTVNQTLSQHWATFAGVKVDRHDDFIVIACTNTYGHGATAAYNTAGAIDAASLDRFTPIYVGYDEDLEERLSLEAFKSTGGEDMSLFHKWMTRVRVVRNYCTTARLERVLITPRCAITGAKYLGAYGNIDTASDLRLYGRMSEDQAAGARAAV